MEIIKQIKERKQNKIKREIEVLKLQIEKAQLIKELKRVEDNEQYKKN